jgi:hypothetical protein
MLTCSSGSANVELPPSPTPLFPWLNARADAAVSETAATANKAVTANRTFVDRNIVFPTIALPRTLECMHEALFCGGKAFSANRIDFVEERDASATIGQSTAARNPRANEPMCGRFTRQDDLGRDRPGGERELFDLLGALSETAIVTAN